MRGNILLEILDGWMVIYFSAVHTLGLHVILKLNRVNVMLCLMVVVNSKIEFSRKAKRQKKSYITF